MLERTPKNDERGTSRERVVPAAEVFSPPPDVRLSLDAPKHVVILSGIPGCGKTTWVQGLLDAFPGEQVQVVSADRFFEGPFGFAYDASVLRDAHAACATSFDVCLDNPDIRAVVVDNTSLVYADRSYYLTASLAAGAVVDVVAIGADPEAAAARNIHGVPASKVAQMAQDMDLACGIYRIDPRSPWVQPAMSPLTLQRVAPLDRHRHPGFQLSPQLDVGRLAKLKRLHGALVVDEGDQLSLVGGSVRDLFLGREIHDLDVATNLLPETVMARAKSGGLRVIPTGLQHGTVTVLVDGEPIEVTTHRSDGQYSDGRRPDCVRLGVSLEEDLSRRDFTINAMAMDVGKMVLGQKTAALVDPFHGLEDLRFGKIRAVGDPLERFREDGLRPMRACRFASQLGFQVETATRAAIKETLDVAAKVSMERVQVEWTKLLCGKYPEAGLQLLANGGLLNLWVPECLPMIGCTQNHYHKFPVWEHVLSVVAHAPAFEAVRWAAMLHDVGKPSMRTVEAETGKVQFLGHEQESVEMAEGILKRFKMSNALTREVLGLVGLHGDLPDASWSDAGCRRFLKRLEDAGVSLDAYAALRLADRLGKGFAPEPILAEHAAVMDRLARIRKGALQVVTGKIAVNGEDLMSALGLPQSIRLGKILARLKAYALEHPEENIQEALLTKARELMTEIAE